MILVLVKMRMTSPQAAQEFCRASPQVIERHQEPGWLGGRCLVDTGDPLHVVLVEEWGSRAAYAAWYTSPARVRYEQETAHLRVGAIHVEMYEDV
jgi:quinol monooxygenase YgiN